MATDPNVVVVTESTALAGVFKGPQSTGSHVGVLADHCPFAMQTLVACPLITNPDTHW